MQSFKLKFSGVTILQGVEFPIFLLIFEWALQQCSATALPVISRRAKQVLTDVRMDRQTTGIHNVSRRLSLAVKASQRKYEIGNNAIQWS